MVTVGAPGAALRSRALTAAPWLLGLAVTALLLGLGERYGYHRDEFYYLASGLHPAWGYVDNPPLTPWIARAEFALFGDSPTALRVAPAVAAGLTVVVAGAIARELGGGPGAAALAAACTGGAAFPLATGHVLSTSTFDVPAWAVLSLLLIRGLRDGGRVWLAAGAVAGVALLNKSLPAAFLGAVAVGVLAVGPRAAFRDRWLWGGALVAVLLWAPFLVWQARNGWPQLAFAHQIGTVGNGGSLPWWAFGPFQLLDVSPLLVPVWVAGLWALWRDPALRYGRAFAVAYGVLFVVLLAAGGKHYYLAGMYPLLLAAGAAPTLRWVRRGRPARGWLLGSTLVVSTVIVAVLMLPLVPVRWLPGSPMATVQPITAETVGWPELAATVSAAYRALPPDQRRTTVVLAENYGEAGAVDLFGRRMELPPAYSGQNSYATWGPPPESATTVLAVGFDVRALRDRFGSVRPVARVDNGIGLANTEQGRTVWLCTDRRDTWARLWPGLSLLA